MYIIILYVVVPLALHNTLDLRRAERVRTLDALRCAFVVIAYYAAVAFRMTSTCRINRFHYRALLSGRLRVGIVMRRSGVGIPGRGLQKFQSAIA